MRPPNIVSLHGDRSVNMHRLVAVWTEEKQRYQASKQVPSSADKAEVLEVHRTRRQRTKLVAVQAILQGPFKSY